MFIRMAAAMDSNTMLLWAEILRELSRSTSPLLPNPVIYTPTCPRWS